MAAFIPGNFKEFISGNWLSASGVEGAVISKAKVLADKADSVAPKTYCNINGVNAYGFAKFRIVQVNAERIQYN